LTIEQEFKLTQIKNDVNVCQELDVLRDAVVQLTRQNMIMKNVMAKMAKS
jgi:hypothetical protein